MCMKVRPQGLRSLQMSQSRCAASDMPQALPVARLRAASRWEQRSSSLLMQFLSPPRMKLQSPGGGGGGSGDRSAGGWLLWIWHKSL